jgi:hypothetical protein
MAGSATLGTNLVDSLVPLADDLRKVLQTDFGVRQFRVWTVQRVWSSGTTGEGEYVDTAAEITPQPLVEPYKTEFSLEPCGVDESGFVVLREISLTYTEAELSGGDVPVGTEWFIKLTDAHGQEIPDSYWLVKKRPWPDRIKDIGWKMELEAAEGAEIVT